MPSVATITTATNFFVTFTMRDPYRNSAPANTENVAKTACSTMPSNSCS